MVNYDLILFDADNTLFDFDKAEKTALKSTLEPMLIQHDMVYNSDVLEEYGIINSKLWKQFEKGEISQEKLQAQRFSKLFERLQIEEDGILYNGLYLSNLAENGFLIEGAQELCKMLSRVCKLIIVTNGFTNVQKKRFEKSEIKEYFADIIVSEETGHQKPQKEYFDYVFDRLGSFDKSKTVLVGDSLSSDMMGGHNAGVATCWYNPKHIENKNHIPVTYEISSLSELIPIIK